MDFGILQVFMSDVALGIYLAVVALITRQLMMWFKRRLDHFLDFAEAMRDLVEHEMKPNGGTSNKETATLKDYMADILEEMKKTNER